MPKDPQRLYEVPGVEPGLRSIQENETGIDWLDRRNEANVMDASVTTLQRQRTLSQLGETSWSSPDRPRVGLNVLHNERGRIREAPILPGRVEHFYRGMSSAEFEEAKGRGFIQSDMRGTFSIPGGEGTNAGIEPGTAHSYMPRQGKGRIVKIAYHPEEQWFESDTDNYARSRQPIPWERVVAHTEEFAHPDSEAFEGLGLREHAKRVEKERGEI
jgi:hypothetical protein